MTPIALLPLLALLSQEERLATIPDRASEIVVNGDASAVAWIEDGRAVVLGDVRSAPYEAVRSLAISRQGSAIAYAAKDKGRWVVVAGGRTSEAYDEVGAPRVEGEGFAFAARKGASWRVVTNGREGPVFDRVDSVALRPDGKVSAYAGWQGKKSILVVGENQGPPFDEVKGMVFYAGGERLAYIGTREQVATIISGPVSPESATLVVLRDSGAREVRCQVGLFDVTEPRRLAGFVKGWLAEGARPSLEVEAAVPWKDVVGILGQCREAGCARVQFSPPSSREFEETFDSLDMLAGAPDGGPVASTGTQRGVLRVFLGGKQSAEFKAVAGLVMGPKRALAYRASDGEGWYAVRGFGWAKGAKKVYKEIQGPVLSLDGTRLAYAAGDGRSWRILSGDYESESYDQVWLPSFQAEDSALVFAARKGNAVFRKRVPLK